MLSKFQEALNQRKEARTLRILKPKPEGIDFYSNDYLGLAQNEELQLQLLEAVQENPKLLSGSSGSRLISGNSKTATDVEQYIAQKHQFPSALVFSSGYHANLALFSALPNRHEAIIVDEHIHRSVHDACKMSFSKKIKFRHNDVRHLEEILKKQPGQSYIAIESHYSMDGDIAPIRQIAALAKRYNANLIVDEAHAFGIFGHGLVEKYKLNNDVLAVVITYGKALGAHGAAILCSETVKSYLANFASPFIYTTAMQDFSYVAIRTGYEFIKSRPELARKLFDNIEIFNKQNIQATSSKLSPIKPIILPDCTQLQLLHEKLSDAGFLTYIINSPTVKAGSERLRICLHSFNTEDEILRLTKIIKEFI